MEDLSAAVFPSASDTEMAPQPNQSNKPGMLSKFLAFTLLFVACAFILQFLSSPTSPHFTRGALPPAFIKNEFIHHTSSNWSELQNLQSTIQEMAWSSTKLTWLSMKAFTTKTSELPWEKAEVAWESVTGKTSDVMGKGSIEGNGFVRVLERLQQFLNLGHELNHAKKSNKRAKHVERPYMRKNAGQEQHRKGKKREEQKSVHRRLKATRTARDGNKEVKTNLFSTLIESPLAAPILAFVGAIFLVASLVSSSDSRRLQRMAASHDGRGIIFDEEEAEILEFYEKEFEAGCFDAMLSFDAEDANAHLDHLEKDEPNENREYNLRFQTDCSTNARNVILGDLYYSRVLQDIEVLGCREVATCEQDEASPHFLSRHMLCPDVPVRLNFDHTRNVTLNSNQEPCKHDMDDCEYNKNQKHTRSESSYISSISSLTFAAYTDNIDSSVSCSTNDPRDDDYPNSSALIVPESQEPPSPAMIDSARSVSLSDSKDSLSETEYTPVIENKCRERKRRMESKIKCNQQLERRVSFSPEVTIKEIPRRQEAVMSSEKYLYFMLFTVGIAIAVFSFLPTHPSLSPITSMTREEIIHRADYLLSSQWDVEL